MYSIIPKFQEKNFLEISYFYLVRILYGIAPDNYIVI